MARRSKELRYFVGYSRGKTVDGKHPGNKVCLQKEYMGTRRTKVTIQGLLVDINRDRLRAFFAGYSRVEDVSATISKARLRRVPARTPLHRLTKQQMSSKALDGEWKDLGKKGRRPPINRRPHANNNPKRARSRKSIPNISQLSKGLQ